MPRPSIDESLATEIRRIHRESQRESAGSFQEALDTVVQLALESPSMDTRATRSEQGWYPGKYAGKIADLMIEEKPSQSDDEALAVRGIRGRTPGDTAIFKARLDEEQRLPIPDTEVDALDLDEDVVLQVYAYALDED